MAEVQESQEQVQEDKQKEAPLTLESINEKVEKGEELSKEETEMILKDQDSVTGYDKGVKFEPKNDEEKEDAPQKEEEGKKDEGEEAKEEGEQILEDKTEQEKEDFLVQIEKALAEPDERKADLSGFNKREKAYFHRMKREIKARQKAEAERDKTLFREQKLKKQLEEKPKEPEIDPLEELRKKDPNDFMTTEDVIKLFEKSNKSKEQKPVSEEAEPEEKPRVDQRWMKYLQLSDKEARETYPDDYDIVMELSSDLVDKNSDYLQEIADSIEKGDNPAIRTYELIKGDKEFDDLLPIAEARFKAKQGKTEEPQEKSKKSVEEPDEHEKKTKAEKAEVALEKNKSKVKTTAHVSSEADKPTDEMSLEEYVNMSDSEFSKLPKKQRESILKKFGA